MPEMNKDTKIVGYPSLLRRLAAMFYDSWLVLACLLLSTAVMIGLRIAIEGSDAMPQGKIAISGAWEIPSFIINTLVILSFFTYFWSKLGQTLGMQTWRLRIDTQDNERISKQQSIIRCFASLFSLTCFGLGYLWALIDKDKQTWHDKISNTQTVLLEKRNKN